MLWMYQIHSVAPFNLWKGLTIVGDSPIFTLDPEPELSIHFDHLRKRQTCKMSTVDQAFVAPTAAGGTISLAWGSLNSNY